MWVNAIRALIACSENTQKKINKSAMEMAQSICNIYKDKVQRTGYLVRAMHISVSSFFFVGKLFLICEALGIMRTIEIYDQTEYNGPSSYYLYAKWGGRSD